MNGQCLHGAFLLGCIGVKCAGSIRGKIFRLIFGSAKLPIFLKQGQWSNEYTEECVDYYKYIRYDTL